MFYLTKHDNQTIKSLIIAIALCEGTIFAKKMPT